MSRATGSIPVGVLTLQNEHSRIEAGSDNEICRPGHNQIDMSADALVPDGRRADAVFQRMEHALREHVLRPRGRAALLEQAEVQAAVHAADAAIAECIAMGGLAMPRYNDALNDALNDELEVRATDSAETAAGCEYRDVTPNANAWRVRLAVCDRAAGS